MKTRLFSTLVLALVVAFSFTFAGEKGEKTTKKVGAKKEMRGCCSEEKSAAAGCSDKEVKHCDLKDAKASSKVDSKAETQTDKKESK